MCRPSCFVQQMQAFAISRDLPLWFCCTLATSYEFMDA
jgi:hypothetical protein